MAEEARLGEVAVMLATPDSALVATGARTERLPAGIVTGTPLSPGTDARADLSDVSITSVGVAESAGAPEDVARLTSSAL